MTKSVIIIYLAHW